MSKLRKQWVFVFETGMFNRKIPFTIGQMFLKNNKSFVKRIEIKKLPWYKKIFKTKYMVLVELILEDKDIDDIVVHHIKNIMSYFYNCKEAYEVDRSYDQFFINFGKE